MAALTSGQFGLVASVLGGASQVGDDLFRGSVGELGGLLPRSGMGIALAAAGLLLLAWALSVLGTVVAFGGFEVAREGDRLRIRRGLIQRREATIPVPRVHAVRIVEGVLRQPFGLALVRVESAGYAQEAATAQTLFPLVRCTEVPALLRQLLPELEAPLAPLAAPPRRAARRYAALPAGVALATGLALATLTPVGPAALVLALPGAGWGWLRHRAAGWRLDPELLVLRFRRLARTTVVVARHRLEERTLSQTPLQRRATLAGFDVSVASGATFGVAHVEASAGQALLAALAPVRSAPRT